MARRDAGVTQRFAAIDSIYAVAATAVGAAPVLHFLLLVVPLGFSRRSLGGAPWGCLSVSLGDLTAARRLVAARYLSGIPRRSACGLQLDSSRRPLGGAPIGCR